MHDALLLGKAPRTLKAEPSLYYVYELVRGLNFVEKHAHTISPRVFKWEWHEALPYADTMAYVGVSIFMVYTKVENCMCDLCAAVARS
jgi:hypothetical protein